MVVVVINFFISIDVLFIEKEEIHGFVILVNEINEKVDEKRLISENKVLKIVSISQKIEICNGDWLEMVVVGIIEVYFH